MAAAEAPLALHVLTGFLGSGKTTLLNGLLKSPRFADAAVLINELGAIPIDHLLVRSAREELVVLASGCVCCTLRTDLVEQLTSLLEQRAHGQVPRFSRIVLETTGIADPAPIVQTVLKHPVLADALFLDGIVCTVDGQLGEHTLQTQLEARKQVSMADRLVLTKVDLTTPDALRAVTGAVRALNPEADVVQAAQGQLDAALLLDIGHLDTRSIASAQLPQPHTHDDDEVQRFAMQLDQPVDFRGFSLWVAMLTQLWGPRILRLKAVISARGEPQPIAVQAVQHVVYPPLDLPASGTLQGKSYVVLLARGLSADEQNELRASFAAFSSE